MAAVGDNNFMRYVYRGEVGEWIPDEATHITVAEDCTFVRARAFRVPRALGHENIVEIICHDGVTTIEEWAFFQCHSVRRVIMPGVRVAEGMSFQWCNALRDVECGKLEIIGGCAFVHCDSLESINLPAARIVEGFAFCECKVLTELKFGNKLERLEERAFVGCRSLERITLPLKDGLITDDIFQACEKLRRVDLVEGEVHETIAALHLEEWKNEVSEEIDLINQILPNTPAGDYDEDDEEEDGDPGEKARTIRRWIRSVLQKIIHYQAEHERILDEAATTIQLLLPRDIVSNYVLPFLELPSHTFEVEEE